MDQTPALNAHERISCSEHREICFLVKMSTITVQEAELSGKGKWLIWGDQWQPSEEVASQLQHGTKINVTNNYFVGVTSNMLLILLNIHFKVHFKGRDFKGETFWPYSILLSILNGKGNILRLFLLDFVKKNE